MSENRFLIELLQRHIQNRGWEEYERLRRGRIWPKEAEAPETCRQIPIALVGKGAAVGVFHTPGCECQARTGRSKLIGAEGWPGSVNHPHYSRPSEQSAVVRGTISRWETRQKQNSLQFQRDSGRRSSPAATYHPILNLTGNSKGKTSVEASSPRRVSWWSWGWTQLWT